MGIELYNQHIYAISQNPNIRHFNNDRNAHFGKAQGDIFQSALPVKILKQDIKDVICRNEDLMKLLKKNNIPVRFNLEELKDLFQNHAKDTQEICGMIYNNLPQALKQKANLKNIKDSALLHDIGKVLIPKKVLCKPGALTQEESNVMNLHSEIGYQILKDYGLNEDVLRLVRNHHNKNVIPHDVNLQVLTLADMYSALTEKRVYKEAFSPKKALTIIRSHVKENDINPQVFNALVKGIVDKKAPVSVRAEV